MADRRVMPDWMYDVAPKIGGYFSGLNQMLTTPQQVSLTPSTNPAITQAGSFIRPSASDLLIGLSPLGMVRDAESLYNEGIPQLPQTFQNAMGSDTGRAASYGMAGLAGLGALFPMMARGGGVHPSLTPKAPSIADFRAASPTAFGKQVPSLDVGNPVIEPYKLPAMLQKQAGSVGSYERPVLLRDKIKQDIQQKYEQYVKDANSESNDVFKDLFGDNFIKEPIADIDTWKKDRYTPDLKFKEYDSPFLTNEAINNIADIYTELPGEFRFIIDNLPKRFKDLGTANEDFGSVSLSKDIGAVFSEPYKSKIAKDIGVPDYFLTIESPYNTGITGRKAPYIVNINDNSIRDYAGGTPGRGEVIQIPRDMIAEEFKKQPGLFMQSIQDLKKFIDDSNSASMDDFNDMMLQVTEHNKKLDDKKARRLFLKTPEGKRSQFKIIKD